MFCTYVRCNTLSHMRRETVEGTRLGYLKRKQCKSFKMTKNKMYNPLITLWVQIILIMPRLLFTVLGDKIHDNNNNY